MYGVTTIIKKVTTNLIFISNVKANSPLICFIISFLAKAKILRLSINVIIIGLYIPYKVIIILWSTYSQRSSSLVNVNSLNCLYYNRGDYFKSYNTLFNKYT